MICRFDVYRAAPDGSCFEQTMRDCLAFVRYPELPGGAPLCGEEALHPAARYWFDAREKEKSCVERGDTPFGKHALDRSEWFLLRVGGKKYWVHIAQFLYDGWTDTPAAQQYRQACESRLIEKLEHTIRRDHLRRAMSKRRARQENEKKWLEEAHREPRRTNPNRDWPAYVPERPLPHIAPRSAIRGEIGSGQRCRHAGCIEMAMPGQPFCNAHGQGYSGGNK